VGLAHVRTRDGAVSVLPGRVARCAWLLALAALLLPRSSHAHDAPFSFVDLRLESGRLEGRVMAHVVDLAREAGLAAPESLLSEGYAQAHLDVLHAALERRLAIRGDGHPLDFHWTSFERVPDRKLLAFHWRTNAAPGALHVEGPLFPYDPLHETYLNVYERGTLVRQDLLDHEHTMLDYGSGPRQSTLAVARTFIGQGIHHIFIGPDHILFILGLLLLGGSLGRLLKIVTAFTVAHSITLALATFQILTPSPRIIEPAIALSIICVGVENLAAQRPARDVRAMLAFAFGFIHGFGFASVLREFGLPREALGVALASFNVGVEIGQACIVLAAVPLLSLARARSPEFGRRVVVGGSAFVILAGGYWFVQRVFFTA
jgi:hydrogenase/urease accessory protein HupE